VLAGLVDLAIAFVVLAILLVGYQLQGYHIPLSPTLLLLPALVVLLALLATGVGLWMSALNVKYRDVRYALPFLVQLWMFATPIIYPASIVPAKWRWALAVNPLSGIIEGFRSTLFGKPLDWTALAISAIITFGFLVYASFSFRRMETRFADLI
jgi:lipopolysaccharide transport system permease protein